MRISVSGALYLSLMWMSCHAPQDGNVPLPSGESAISDEYSGLRSALTLYASFDDRLAADHAQGDPALYTAPRWNALDDATPVRSDDSSVTHLPADGRYGGALQFHSDWNPIVFFRAENNIDYRPEDWSGAFSFWLRIVPDEELDAGYSDPFIVTDKNWDDASLYVDFTEADRPRRFRFAAFADKSVWNPEGASWESIPPSSRPMIDIESAPFAGGEWTHVVLTFDALNTGRPGRMIGYINGTEIGRLDDRVLTISWDVDRVLMALGRHYAGALDELTVFNRALTEAEVKILYTAPVQAWLAESD